MRITGGALRNRTIAVPKGLAVRPTTDMVRQAVFNILLGYGLPEGAVVLDAFCGTGALGLEALSRGASSCVFIDKVIDTCRNNVEALNISDQSTVLKQDVLKLSKRRDKIPPAELVFLDPPYRDNLVVPSLEVLIAGDWLAAGALCVVETEKNMIVAPPAGLSLQDQRDYSDTQITFLSYNP